MKKERSLSNEKKKLETDKLTLEAKIKELDAYLEEKNEQVYHLLIPTVVTPQYLFYSV